MIPDPYQSPQRWDTVRVNGTQCPFTCTVHEFHRKWDWDEKKIKGGQGASLTYTGFHLARGAIDFWLLSGIDPTGKPWQHLAQWAAFIPNFQYDATKNPANAVKIYHPSLAMMNLNKFICEDITNPTQVEIGLYKSTVMLIEWAPPPKLSAVSTPTGTGSGATPGTKAQPGTPPDPTADALQKQIAQQLALAQLPP